MTQSIEAVYENGVLRPVKPLKGIPERAHVKITLKSVKQPHPLDEVFGTISDEDAKLMREAIEEAFEKVDPDEWK